MELFSIFRTYLKILKEHYEAINSSRRSQGEIVEIKDFGNYCIIGIKLENNRIRFQSSERVLIDEFDSIVEHYQKGRYYFRVRPDLNLERGSNVSVSSTSDLVFLVENMLTNLESINSSEYGDLVKNLYSGSSNEEWQIGKSDKQIKSKFTESQKEVISTALKLLEIDMIMISF